LNSATDSFIEAETTINADSKTISTSSFSGIKVILAQIKILILIEKIFNLQINDYLLKYTDYNWTKN
jgi:ABC-type protease/lipase transport system fused ATPase/permease subunit